MGQGDRELAMRRELSLGQMWAICLVLAVALTVALVNSPLWVKESPCRRDVQVGEPGFLAVTFSVPTRCPPKKGKYQCNRTSKPSAK